MISRSRPQEVEEDDERRRDQRLIGCLSVHTRVCVCVCVGRFAGAGESGKSTILKQMKLIHEGGYSRDERESFKEIIFSNTVQSMRVILEAMESLELPLADQRQEYHVQTVFMQPAQIEGDSLPPEVGTAIEALWKDEGVQECFKRSREYQLNDSAK